MSSLSETMIIGLTGGIASGKSIVVEMIKEAGCKVIDADQLVHDMQAQGGRLFRARPMVRKGTMMMAMAR